MKFIAGVDPGLTGAIALLDQHGDLMAVYDINGVDGRMNVSEANRVLRDWLDKWPITMAVVENVGPMPKQGLGSTSKFMRATGAAEALVQCLFIPMDLITPAKWKGQMRMTKKDKDFPRQWCQKRWPTSDKFDAKGKGQARADAACIALAWLEMHPEWTTPTTPSKRPRRAAR